MLEQLGIDLRFVAVMAAGFVLLFLLLKKFAFGPVFTVLVQRQEKIRGDLDEAEARRNEMIRLQHEYEERLAKIEEEARDKIQAAVKEAQAARDEIIAKAQAERELIVERGHDEVLREREKVMAGIRDQLAEMAVTGAQRIIKQDLSAGSHARLIDDVISGISTQNGAVNGAAGSGR